MCILLVRTLLGKSVKGKLGVVTATDLMQADGMSVSQSPLQPGFQATMLGTMTVKPCCCCALCLALPAATAVLHMEVTSPSMVASHGQVITPQLQCMF